MILRRHIEHITQGLKTFDKPFRTFSVAGSIAKFGGNWKENVERLFCVIPPRTCFRFLLYFNFYILTFLILEKKLF